jgi:phosphoribosylamine-glycine ligase
MKVLVIGFGARENALALKIKQLPVVSRGFCVAALLKVSLSTLYRAISVKT